MSDWTEDERPWQAKGKCAAGDRPLNFFFPIHEVSPTHDTIKAYCGACPVRLECFSHSLTWPELHGSWGGVDQWTRARLVEEKVPHLCVECGRGLDPDYVLKNLSGKRTLRRCRACR